MKKKTKLLFVITKDFGELYNAVQLAEGLSAENEIHFLMPEKMFNLNSNQFCFPLRKYSSFADLKKELIGVAPLVCFLFSGYLLTINNLISNKELEQFLGLINKMKIKLVTSDPWLNIWATVNTLNYPTLNLNDPMQSLVYSINRALNKKFNAYYHLYNFPLREQTAKEFNFFNKKILYGSWQRYLLSKSFNEKIPELKHRKFWLFIVSGEDAVLLRDKVSLLAAKLEETLLAARLPVLIAPQDLLERVKSYLPNISNMVLWNECALVKFKLLLFKAEYVFYWNVFSATVLPRVLNGGKVFFFDHGHMAKVFPPFLELGRKVYYGGSNLFLIDPHNKLILRSLKKTTGRQKYLRKYLITKLSRQSSPSKIIKILLENDT